MLYASTENYQEENVESADANTYRPFKVLDSIIMKSIQDQVDALGEPEEEGTLRNHIVYAIPTDVNGYIIAPIGFVGALTKSLCRKNAPRDLVLS